MSQVALRAGVSPAAGLNEIDPLDIEDMEKDEVKAMLKATEAEVRRALY